MPLDLQKETLKIEGMSCGHCVASVTQALEKTTGVVVDAVEIGQAKIRYGKELQRSVIVEAIEDLGFDVVEA